MTLASWGQPFKAAFHTLKDLFQRAVHEVRLVAEGFTHLGSASDNIRDDFERDCLTCGIETGLALSEGVAIEATISIAAAETAEKMINTGDRNVLKLTGEFIESVASSPIAAMHAAANAVHDLERSGAQWEAAHLRI